MKWKIIIFSIIAVILAGICALVAHHTAGFKHQVKTFYVTCNGTTVTTSIDGYEMAIDKPLDIVIRYVLRSDEKGYSVKVVPNRIEEKDFKFTVDGIEINYSEIEDLTKGFDIKYNKSSFSIKPKGALLDVLNAVYEGRDVEDCSKNAYMNMFSLVISSYNEKSNVIVNFTVSEEVAGIVFDREEIIF